MAALTIGWPAAGAASHAAAATPAGAGQSGERGERAGDLPARTPPTAHGPKLTVGTRKLRAALDCHGVHRGETAVLLVPGTTLDAHANFSWNYEREFSREGRGWCGVSPPEQMMGDAQIAAEYVVYAIRAMAARTGERVDILGYSQGGMLPRWALKYWPDTRRDVDDLVGIDPSNHGTLDADAACAFSCPPAFWQQRDTSNFLRALNAGPETWPGISYTVVYSRTDEVVVPNVDASGSSSLHTGRGRIANIAVQQICPADVSEHLAMGSYDPVAAAVAVDAFSHHGPASASRIPSQVCSETFMPGVDPTAFPQDYAAYLRHIVTVVATAKQTRSEPALKRYAR